MAAVCAISIALAGARADEYPSRPITLIVPFAPGGSTDVIARVVAEGLRSELGQAVVVENRAGAGGTLGTAVITKAAADGYTIGMGTASTLAINPAAYRALPYDVLTDLVPIGIIAAVPNVMTVNPRLPVTSVDDLIQLARTRRLTYGSSGNGSVAHLMGEQFKLATATDLVHVPYRGIGPALNDAIGGQIDVLFDNLPSSLPQIAAGRLRALAHSAPGRLAVLPGVPTFAELNLGDLDWRAFFGLVAPAGTPAPVIARLHAALGAVLQQHSVRTALAAQQAVVVADTPEQFAAEIARALERFRQAVKAANIQVN